MPKAFVDVAGRPLLSWSVDAFAEAASVSEVIVAAPPGSEERVVEIAGDAIVVTGGATRAESVANGLRRASGDAVAVHDAARPLVTPGLIDALLARLAVEPELAGVIAAAPVADTLKRGDGDRIAETIDRAGLWSAQTPQAFRAQALRAALPSDPAVLALATDEAMLVEASGGKVAMHDPGAPNPKLTTPADLRLIEALLRASGRW